MTTPQFVLLATQIALVVYTIFVIKEIMRVCKFALKKIDDAHRERDAALVRLARLEDAAKNAENRLREVCDVMGDDEVFLSADRGWIEEIKADADALRAALAAAAPETKP